MAITKDILDWVVPLLPLEKPRYTMGLGFSPLDLFDAVEHGADMFDCVAPTRIARNGGLYVHPKINKTLRVNITNAQYTNDKQPIDPECTCTTCSRFSRSYLHHLFAANELLAYRLATMHNLHFFISLMNDIRGAIKKDRLLDLKQQWIATN